MELNYKKFLIGHGDGLGPGDEKYKIIKKIFTNKFCQWLFKWVHPDVGIAIAEKWSGNSRISNLNKLEDKFKGLDEEWLYQYCVSVEKRMHFDYFIFGHRHLPLELKVGKNSMYINLGEWVNQCTFGEFDGENFHLKKFEG